MSDIPDIYPQKMCEPLENVSVKVADSVIHSTSTQFLINTPRLIPTKPFVGEYTSTEHCQSVMFLRVPAGLHYNGSETLLST